MQPTNTLNDSTTPTDAFDSLKQSSLQPSPEPQSEPQTTPQPAMQPMPQPQPQKSQNKNKLLILLILLILLLLGAGIGVGIVLYNSSQSSTNNTQTSQTEEPSDEEDDTEKTAQTLVEINESATAKVEDDSFSIVNADGETVIQDDRVEVTGILSCDDTTNESAEIVRCEVTTAEGDGVFVYYPEEEVLKFGLLD